MQKLFLYLKISSLIIALFSLSSCSEDEKNSSSSAPPEEGAETSEEEVAEAGTLILGEFKGQILPKEGADVLSVSGASVTGANRPEISATTDGEGNFKVSNIAPGSLSVMVTSTDGATLALTGNQSAKYGLKFDNILISSGASTDLGSNVFKETGSLSGTVKFFENPNKLDLVGSEVFLPGTSYISKTDANGKFTISGVPEGEYQIRIQHEGFSKLDLANITVIEATDTVLDSIFLSLSTGPEGRISIVEDLSSSINGIDSKIAKSREVVIELSYDSDAALMKIASEPSFLNTKWVPVSKIMNWVFESDGKKALYVAYSDLNGLESSPFSEEFYVDTIKPNLVSVSLLNGWDQIGTLTTSLVMAGDDSGTGISEVMFSNVSNSFNSGETWQPYEGSKMNWTLAAGGDGSRTVFMKLRDHALRESVIVSDGILKGPKTIIKNLTYDFPVALDKSQSPFETTTSITFLDTLSIAAGVTIDLGGNSVELKGVVTAVGTSDKPIEFTNGAFYTRYASAAVSEKNIFDYVKFVDLTAKSVNGGTYTNCTFDSSGNPYVGKLEKYGSDNLIVKNSSFIKWNGNYVAEGNSAVTFEGNTADVDTWIVQYPGFSTKTTGSVSRDNTITQKTGTTRSVFVIESGVLLSDGDTVIASANAAVFSADDAATTFDSTINIKNPIVSGCKTAFTITAPGLTGNSITSDGGTVTNCTNLAANDTPNSGPFAIQNLTGTGIDYAALNTVGASGLVSITQSDISVKNAFLYIAWLDAKLSLTNSKLTCQNAAGTCDFLYHLGINMTTYSTLTMTNNNIFCIGDTATGCRGFTAKQSGGGDLNITSSISGNFWNNAGSKALTTGNFATPLTTDATLNAEIRAYSIDTPTVLGTWPPSVAPVAAAGNLAGNIGPQ